MNIGYGKIGRSFALDLANASVAGGDVDVVRTLHRLATARPDDTFWIIGRNSGECPQDVGLPANVRNLWGEEPMKSKKLPKAAVGEKHEWTDTLWEAHGDVLANLDHIILWLGQHGTSNRAGGLPQIKDRSQRTNPQDSSVLYSGYLLGTVNRWRDIDPVNREEIWLCPDPRNYFKCRDARWPLHHPILAQYEQERKVKHERYERPGTPEELGFGDVAWTDADSPGLWLAKQSYSYSALEMTALPRPENVEFSMDHERVPFGIISNENRAYVANDRLSALKQWVLGWCPDVPLHGIWSDKSKEELGRDVQPVPLLEMLPTMATFKSTFTMAASGSGWATAKPWEAFAVGTVCFFHPKYDEQSHILNGLDDWTRTFLRVKSAGELEARVQQLEDDSIYRYVATQQRRHYEDRFASSQGGVAAMLDRIARS